MTESGKPLIIDGLVIAKWSRAVFEAMHRGGLSAANCTCSVWEDFPTTMKAVADWKRWFHEHDDLLLQVYTTADIDRARQQNKVGIILGWQNTTGFGDYLPLVPVYAELGLRVVQMTYNTANTVGSGCYEGRDGGLTDFGRELVAALNEAGILIDLSHVGGITAQDTILASAKPVAYTHCLPAALKAHPRNKSDEELRFIAQRDGFVGVTMFPPFLAHGIESTVDDCVAAIEHVVNVVGEDSVGIGTDFTEGYDEAFFTYITRDKGYARPLTRFGEIKMPAGFESLEDYPNLITSMQRRGWAASRIDKVMGGNWLGFLKRVWHA